MAHASYTPFNTNVSGNIGIGSAAPGQRLDVNGSVRATAFIGSGAGLTGINTSQWTTTNTNDVYLPSNGNVGLGTTITNAGAALTVMNGNVGIGTWVPGQTMDVKGTVRTTGFVMSGQGPTSGYVLTAIDGTGNATWTAPGNISGAPWLQSGNNVYTSGSNNVGIGTTTPQGAFVVTNGNVGIGTWVPSAGLEVSTSSVSSTDAALMVGIPFSSGTGNSSGTMLGINSPSGFSGNLIDIHGNNSGSYFNLNAGTGQVNTIYFNASSFVQTPTLFTNQGTSLSIGSSLGVVLQSGVSSNYSGNVGIGTGAAIGSKLVVNGSVGIGTGNASPYVSIVGPSGGLIVQNNVGIGTFNPFGGGLIVMPTNTGNVGIGSLTPGQALDVQGTVRATAFIGSGSQLSGINTSQWTVTNTNDVYLPNSGNVGIGTTKTTTAALTVMNGNVGIGTWVPSVADLVISSNGQDFVHMINQSNGSTYMSVDQYGLLTSNNMSTNTISPGAISYLNAYLTTATDRIQITNHSTAITATTGIDDLVNINDAFAPTSGTGVEDLVVLTPTINQTGGANGITRGIFVNPVLTAASDFRAFESSLGNVGIGTISGNLGIGSQWPGQRLDVQGTVRALYFSGNGSQLTGIGGMQWTTTNTNDVYLPNNGNVGLGTTITGGAALSVMNGNVGIGTWVPGQSLDVKGTVRTTGFVMSGQGPTSGYVLTAIDGTGNATWTAPGNISGAPWLQSGNNVYTSGSNNVGIGTTTPQGAFVVTNGNVGIGTWVPGALVDENGAFTPITGIIPVHKIGTNVNNIESMEMRNTSNGNAAEFRFLISDNNGDDDLAFTVPGTGNGATLFGQTRSAISAIFQNHTTTGRIFAIGTADNEPMFFGTNNTERERIDINGNVGIGIQIPLSKLNVNGGVGIGTSATNLAYLDNNSAPSGGLIVQGNVGIGTFSPFGGGLIVLPSNTGNVGIGSLTPGQALDVTGTVRAIAFIGNGAQLTGINSSQWTTTNTNDVYLPNNGNVGLGTTITGAGAALTVMNGNVGIGTWVPNTSLNISGGGTINGSTIPIYVSSSATTRIDINSSAASPNTGFALLNNGAASWSAAAYKPSGTNLSFTFYNDALSASALFINGDTNNVGVGTIVPASRLNINGGVGIGTTLTNGNYLNGNSAPSGGLIVQGNVGIGTWAPTNNEIEMNVGIGTAFTTTSALTVMNGNVGIGTWVPVSQLQVTNNAITATIADGLLLSNYTPATNGSQKFSPSLHFIGQGWKTSATAASQQGEWQITNEMIQGASAPTEDLHFNPITNGSANSENFGICGSSSTSFAIINLDGGPNGDCSINDNSGGAVAGFGPVNAGNEFGAFVSGTEEILFTTTGLGLTNTVKLGWASGTVGNSTTTDTSFTRVSAGNVGIGTNGIAANNAQTNGGLMLGNIGIGTTLIATSSLTVMNGNVGIGTWVPGQSLDVKGTVRTTGFVMSGQGPTSGYVLTAIDGTGNATWTAPGNISGAPWLQSGNNVYTSGSNNVGIGTTTPQGAFVVTNGNVGIGTWVPAYSLAMSLGNTIGIGTTNAGGVINVSVQSASSTREKLAEFSVSDAPGDVFAIGNSTNTDAIFAPGFIGYMNTSSTKASINFIGETISAKDFGNAPLIDYNAREMSGDYLNGAQAAITARPLFEWDNNGIPRILINANGNLGIGTILPSSTLNVNGGVGIGTTLTNNAYLSTNSAPSGGLIVQGNVGIGTFNPFGGGLIVLPANTGNVGIGSLTPGQALDVSGSIRMSTGSGGSLVFADGTSQSTAATVGSNYWLNNGGSNVGINTTQAVGIGTSFVGGTGEATLAVMNGNVGIGTWVPAVALQIVSATSPQVRIYGGSTQRLALNVANGISYAYGYDDGSSAYTDFVIGASSGVTSPPIYVKTNGSAGGGNVGIGTTTPAGALTVMNGNVGIGTWIPANPLQVNGGISYNYRIGTTTSSTTPSIPIGPTGYDIYEITALSGAITTVTFTGTPSDGEIVELIITDNGTARGLTFGAGSTIAATTVALPTTTVISTPLRIFFQYNAGNTTWYCIGVA